MPSAAASAPCSTASHSTQNVPSILTEEREIEGFRQPQWTMRELQAGEALAVQRALLVIEERMKPVTRHALRAHFARLANHFRNERSPEQIAVLFDDYAADLEPFSEAHIEEAMREHRRTKTWFPKVAEIRATALKLQGHDRVLRHRARVLLGLEEAKSWEKPRPARAVREEPIGARPQLEAKIDELPSELGAAVRRLYERRQERLGRPGPLFDRKSA